METFDGKSSRRLDESRSFFETPVYTDFGFAFLNSVSVGVCRPGEGGSRAERLVSPCKGSVDDVLAISAYSDESDCKLWSGIETKSAKDLPSVRTVLQRLRVDFGRTKIAQRNIKTLAIFDCFSCHISLPSSNGRVEQVSSPSEPMAEILAVRISVLRA